MFTIKVGLVLLHVKLTLVSPRIPVPTPENFSPLTKIVPLNCTIPLGTVLRPAVSALQPLSYLTRP